MQYHCGSRVLLGDIVRLPAPDGSAIARVVMSGDTKEHLEVDPSFPEWTGSSDVLRATAIVVEWTDRNPFAHNDPAFAPVGNYMFTDVDEFVELQSRAKTFGAA